jgi:hypothetical protein
MKNFDDQELKQKHEERNSKLKAAYKPLLPDDIYRKNYDSNVALLNKKICYKNLFVEGETKLSLFRQISPRDKVIFLPILKAPIDKTRFNSS